MLDDTMVDAEAVEAAEAAARAMLDRRVALVRELAAAAGALEPLQRAAAEAERRLQTAWADAVAGGWTADELGELGYPEPERPDRKAGGKKAAVKPKPAAPPQPRVPAEPETMEAPQPLQLPSPPQPAAPADGTSDAGDQPGTGT